MIGHPDADTLAACREGLLGRRRSARIRAHLARCSRCASLDRELDSVTTMLASAPAPRIPDEVAAWLDTVLAAESAARARGQSPAADGIPAIVGATAGAADGQAAPGGQGGRAPGQPRSTRPARPWRVTALRAASVTAALLVIAGGGYGVSRLLQGGHNAGISSSSAPGRAAGPAGSRNGAAIAGGGGSSAPASARAGLMMPSAGVPAVHSGTDYQPGQLVAQAEAVLARPPARSGAQSITSLPATTLTGCVKLFAGGAQPTLVDEASYFRQPATIIIRAPARGQTGRVWVIVPRCSAAGRQLIATAVLPASG